MTRAGAGARAIGATSRWIGRTTTTTMAMALLLLTAPVLSRAGLNVVATTPDLGAIVSEVGGKLVQLTVLTRPTEDPHFVDAKPSFIVKLNKADALVEGGAELEIGWLPPLLQGARNPKLAAGAPGRISCAAALSLLEVPTTLDRSQGDVHAAGNPHYMVDPLNARTVADLLAKRLSALDSANAAAYQANAARFQARIDAKLPEWQKALAPYKGRRVVSYHNLWPYFAKRFDLVFDLFLEPKPGIPPTPAHLSEVLRRMKAENSRVIIVEPFQSRRTAESIADQTGAVVVGVTQYPGGVKGTEGGYIEMMDFLVRVLAEALAAKS